LQSSLSVTTETRALSDRRSKAGRRLATLPMKTDPVVPRPESGVSGRPPSPWALIVDYAVETPDSARGAAGGAAERFGAQVVQIRGAADSGPPRKPVGFVGWGTPD
jgi:hypothetical protein